MRCGSVYYALANSNFTSERLFCLYEAQTTLSPKFCSRLKANIKALASRKAVKKVQKVGDARKLAQPTKEANSVADKPTSIEDYVQPNNFTSTFHNSANISSRSTVLKACTITSGLIAALGVLIRQVSHVAATEGWPVLDCSTEISFGFEAWHLGLIIGLVILLSSSRYLLLKTWPDFAESSETANQQVLSSLQPLDYIVVAFLPGISEELLFRGALLPLFGINWKSVLIVSAIFGFLHLGSGRKYSFALWATFVGFAYGYATIASSNIIVPMASHAVNNLVGGILWRYTMKSSE